MHTFDDDGGRIEVGTIGWDDRDAVLDDGSAENDGHTLVYVTLYRGKNPTTPKKTGIAQGTKIQCVLADNVSRAPAKGARCYVALPAGMDLTDGAGVIIATVTPGPEIDANTSAGAASLCASSGVARVRVGTDGSITLYTTDSNDRDGNGIFLRITTSYLKFGAPWGTLTFDASGFHLSTSGGQRFDLGMLTIPIPGLSALPGDVVGALTGYCTITAPQIKLAGSNVLLGESDSDTWQPVLWSMVTPPISPLSGQTGTQSQSVWCAP